MAIKRGLYFHLLLSQKLNKKKYDYDTLAKCFDIAYTLTNWDDKSRRIAVELDYSRQIDIRRVDRDTLLPSLRQVMRGECRDKQVISNPKQYTALNTALNNIFHNIKDKPFLQCPKPLSKHLAKKNPNEYSSFHNSTGHATKGC